LAVGPITGQPRRAPNQPSTYLIAESAHAGSHRLLDDLEPNLNLASTALLLSSLHSRVLLAVLGAHEGRGRFFTLLSRGGRRGQLAGGAHGRVAGLGRGGHPEVVAGPVGVGVSELGLEGVLLAQELRVRLGRGYLLGCKGRQVVELGLGLGLRRRGGWTRLLLLLGMMLLLLRCRL
jgi:hypothetical protein